MSDAGLWQITVGALALASLLLIVLLAEGAYQVFTGRPGILPFERILFKRTPATQLDCVRQGASKILQAAATACIMAPSAVIAVRNTAALTGVIPSGPHAPPSPLLDALVFVGLFGPLAIGVALGIAAYLITTRINYVAAEPRVQRI